MVAKINQLFTMCPAYYNTHTTNNFMNLNESKIKKKKKKKEKKKINKRKKKT